MDEVMFFYNADDPSVIFPGISVNRGIDEVLKRLDALQRAGVRVVNTAKMSDDERAHQYFEAASWPSVKKHYRVKACFGRAGISFGRGVPALAVRGEDGMPSDVYPHENKDMSGQYITISDYFLHHGGLPQ